MASNRGRTVAEVVRRFGVAADRALFVGDAPSDLEAAAAAGIHFVAVGEHDWVPRAVGAKIFACV